MRPFFETDYPRSGSRGSLAPVQADTIDARVLAAGAAEVHAVPTGAQHVLFSATGDFFAKFGASGVAAAVPAADVTNGSAPELNPAARRVPDGATHVALVAPAACTVTLSWYGA